MDFRRARERMVEEQLEARGICHPALLEAMRAVPRHLFVEEALAPTAHGDHALPIGFGQTISQPYMVGLMTELLRPTAEHRILEIGAGSGYQSAVLARLVRTVFAIERIPDLAVKAQKTLHALGVENVVLRIGDGTLGWRRFAPFDGILVAAAAPGPPPTLIEQLRAGGRLVIPTGSRGRQSLHVLEKDQEGRVTSHHAIDCTFVPLLGREGWSGPDG
jgi:protein-L-isoaspartate(D-aspartate) O-methyltransferase